jgi:hypothetical protein
MSNAVDFNTMETAQVVDAAAYLKAQIKELEAQFAAAEKVIRERATDKELAGNMFKAVFSEGSVRWNLDTEKVKKEMGEQWWTKNCKISTPKPSLTFKINVQ